MDVISALTAQSKTVKRLRNGEVMFQCPAHKDRRASASARELPDGRFLIHCFAGCTPEEILSAVGLTFTDLFPKALGQHYSPERRAFAPALILQVLKSEIGIVRLIAFDMVRGKTINQTDFQRLERCAMRIDAGMQAGGLQ